MDSILIDTDPALGLPFADVDDALALQTLAAAGAPVAGLTTCFGNASLEKTHAVAQELGERFAIPVHRGASRPGDVSTEAADALLAHRGSVLAIAPLTNVAAALARGARWSQLVILGGTFGRLPNIRPIHTSELNLALDVGAATAALPACTTLVTMDVCRNVLFTAREVALLPRWIADRCRGWLRLSPLMTGRRGFHPWDVLAAMRILDPGLFATERRNVAIVPSWLHRGHLRDGALPITVTRSVDGPVLVAAWSAIARRVSG
ncbi:MAG: nucleoside hydrolase [Acidobacteriota bacterium]